MLYQDESGERAFDYRIFGYYFPQSHQNCNENVKSAGLSKYIQLSVQHIDQLEAPAGKIYCDQSALRGAFDLKNFPTPTKLLASIKHRFRARVPGVSSQDRLLHKIGLKPTKKVIY